MLILIPYWVFWDSKSIFLFIERIQVNWIYACKCRYKLNQLQILGHYYGEGNGNPLHYSCLENPRDGGAWWAAIYRVAQSQIRLKRLSSCSSMHCSVQFSRSVISDSLWLHGLQHARPPHPAPTPGACSNSYPLSQWCDPTISSSVVPFSSCLQSCPTSGCFPLNQFFSSHGQSIGVLASASVLPVIFQDWFPIGWTGLISL